MTAHDTPVEGSETPFEAVVDELPSTSGGEGASSGETGFLNTSLTRRFKGKIQPLSMPSYEQMMQEDVMNNCAVKSAIAGVMGGLLGVAFGIFTASLDTGVRARALFVCRARAVLALLLGPLPCARSPLTAPGRRRRAADVMIVAASARAAERACPERTRTHTRTTHKHQRPPPRKHQQQRAWTLRRSPSPSRRASCCARRPS
jgi:hypothetical protein